jgi:hypothetical protein
MPGLDGLAHVIRPAAGRPEAALVLMHGRVAPELTTWVQERRASAPLS